MKWIFDLDGTICDTKKVNGKWDYDNSKPKYEVIGRINELHEKGHKIVIFTARGSTTGNNFESITRKQLKEWNIFFDELILGKPAGDVYVDDRTITPEFLLNNWSLIDGLIGSYE